MPSSPNVKIVWYATTEPDEASPPLWGEKTTLASWAGLPRNALYAVQRICADFFDDYRWAKEFDMDDAYVEVWVTVDSPAEIAGRYHVDLRRVTTAMAERVKEST